MAMRIICYTEPGLGETDILSQFGSVEAAVLSSIFDGLVCVEVVSCHFKDGQRGMSIIKGEEIRHRCGGALNFPPGHDDLFVAVRTT